MIRGVCVHVLLLPATPSVERLSDYRRLFDAVLVDDHSFAFVLDRVLATH